MYVIDRAHGFMSCHGSAQGVVLVKEFKYHVNLYLCTGMTATCVIFCILVDKIPVGLCINSCLYNTRVIQA